MADLKRFLRAVAVSGLLGFMGMASYAAEYPERPIRFVAPIPAGGSTEVLAREVAHRLGERLGQPVVVENRPGGAGSVGTAHVASAEGDGYTILLVNSSHSINPHVYELSFDPLKDFTPVSLMTDLPMGIFVHPSVPANTLQELIELIKEEPEKYTFASSGNGGAGHLTGQIFQQEVGVKIEHVPYRGSAPAVNDVLAGHVPILSADVPVATPHVKSGALKALAVTSPERAEALPDVPTFTEEGFEGVTLAIWIGVLAPAGTPEHVVDLLSEHIAEILNEPEMNARVRERGFNIVGSTPTEFAEVMQHDYDRYGRVVRETGVKAE